MTSVIFNYGSPGFRVPLLEKVFVKRVEISRETVVAAIMRGGLTAETFVFTVTALNGSSSFQMKDLVFKVLERFVA